MKTPGTVIFPDTSGNRVDVYYLQLLENLDEMNKYSWATGVLAFVLGEMSKRSRIKTNQIGGYLTLVQVWIYDHFPSLGLAKEKTPYPYGQPTTGKWLFWDPQKKSKEEQLTSLREKLDKLTVNNVVFHPYAVPDDVPVDEEDLNGFSTVSDYYGPIWYPNGYAIYNPRRILRQLCCVQMDPDVENENFNLLVEGTKNTEKYFEPKHEPTPTVAHWNTLGNYYLPLGDCVPCEGDVNACDEDYMEFYQEISHPFVINKEQQAKTDAARRRQRRGRLRELIRRCLFVEKKQKGYGIM
ncbi:protein MAINTENANCE OF MERISTEMS-like [Papaver somniferum]|uniref:protein MAINTENANCE OF MERISTEMS-like n=1 Tax=Papaver somniferum TaxID=3469 RepID=UPI000E705560|nr:protein MAINTENANCE OF MERISTEMS-like [Papaver somniferum]